LGVESGTRIWRLLAGWNYHPYKKPERKAAAGEEDNFLFALKRDGNELLTLGCEVWSTWDPTKADPYQ